MNRIHPNKIRQSVCHYYDVHESELNSKRRDSFVILKARHVCSYLMRYKCHMRYNEISRHLAGRHHSTIINSIKKINETTYPGIEDEIKEIILHAEQIYVQRRGSRHAKPNKNKAFKRTSLVY